VHHPQLCLNLSQGELRVLPLRDKVCQGLRFDGFAGRISEVLTHEFDRPFGDSSCGLSTSDDLSQGEGRYHRDRVTKEVV